MNCRNCNKAELKKIIPIGKQPLSGIFPRKKKLKLKKYSLDLFICKKCKLVQLGKSASAKDMFGEEDEAVDAEEDAAENYDKNLADVN